MKNLACFLLCLAALLASAAANAGAGHYIVVTMDDTGKATPVFYRSVNFTEERSVTSASLKATLHDADHLFIQGNGWADVAEVPRFIRGEFAKNGVSGDIKAYQVEQQERAFALRIPARAGASIKLDYLGVKSELNVQQVANNAGKLALANFEVKAPNKAFVNSANRVDILVLGDGYTAAEQATFNADAERLRVAMFDYVPYKQYANFVNWTTTFNASAQSGADHPPYQAGCTSTSCCADTAAQSDPRAAGAGMFVNTAFDGKFCTSQIHRLVTINYSKVLTAASAFPGYDQLIVLINDPIYGGSGGSIAVTTTNTNANLIVIHEYGHTFHDLADEYTSAYPGFPACSDISPSNNCEANVTNQTVPSLIKWRSWIGPSTPIPTPSGTGVGLFEGARYQTTGVYRPQNSCGMRSLGAQFCSICSQAYVLKLYRGGFGTPSAGIDLIEPGTEVPSAASSVAYTAGSNVNFSASVLRPNPDTVTLQWYLDGVAIPGATSSNFDFQQLDACPSTRKLELRATDNSTLVKAEMAGTDMVHSRTWTINIANPLPSLSINDVSVIEGHAGVVLPNFSINLSSPAPVGGVRFDVATVPLRSNGVSALPKIDYAVGQQNAKIIPEGQATANFAVKVVGDRLLESNEVFGVKLSNVTGACLSKSIGIGTIMNDDQASLLGIPNHVNTNATGISVTRPQHSSAPNIAIAECDAMKTSIAQLEAKMAANRLNETEGMRNILRLENKRQQLRCQ